MQKLQKKPTTKQSLRFFNPAKTSVMGMLPLYHLVSNTGTLFPARDIARSLLTMLELLWRPPFCITCLLSKNVVFKQSEHGTRYHTIHAAHAGALSGLWHSSLIKLLAQSLPISLDVELHLWCVLTAIRTVSSPSRRAEMFCSPSYVENTMNRRIKGWNAFLKVCYQGDLDLNLRTHFFWQ